MAGVQGFEPQLADPESAVLPLNDTPLYLAATVLSAVRVSYDTPTLARCQALGACGVYELVVGRQADEHVPDVNKGA